MDNPPKNLLPIDLTKLSIKELTYLYDAVYAADRALISIFHQPNVDREEAACEWIDVQAQAFTWLCQLIRNEMLKRPEPDDTLEASMRREVVLGYALRCGDDAEDLQKLLIELGQGIRQAA